MSTFKRDRLVYRVALSIADRKVDARLEYDGHNETQYQGGLVVLIWPKQ